MLMWVKCKHSRGFQTSCMVRARLLCKQFSRKNSLGVYTVWIQFCVPAETRTNWAVKLYNKSLRIYQDWPAHRARTAHACLVMALRSKKFLTGCITFQTSILKVVCVYILTNLSTILFCKKIYTVLTVTFLLYLLHPQIKDQKRIQHWYSVPVRT